MLLWKSMIIQGDAFSASTVSFDYKGKIYAADVAFSRESERVDHGEDSYAWFLDTNSDTTLLLIITLQGKQC